MREGINAIAHADIDIPLVGGRVNFWNGTDEIGRDPNDLTRNNILKFKIKRYIL